jgi:hypothetical protein
LIIICILAFANDGCDKKIKKEGKFTCEINGVAFKVDGCYAIYRNNKLKITAIQERPEKANIVIQLNAEEPGTFICNTSDFSGESNTAKYVTTVPTPEQVRKYDTDSIYTGIVIITSLDDEDETVSGTYKFQAVQHHGGSDVVSVSGAFEKVLIDNDRSSH